MNLLYVEKALTERVNMILDKIPDAIPVGLTLGAGVLLLVHEALEETKQVLAILAILIGIALQVYKVIRDRHMKKEIEQIKVARQLTAEELHMRIQDIEKRLNDD